MPGTRRRVALYAVLFIMSMSNCPLSRQSEKFLFGQYRKFLLTPPSWRDESRGTNRDESGRARQVALVEAGEGQEGDAEESGGADGSQPAVGAQAGEKDEAEGRRGGCARPARPKIQPQACGENAAGSDRPGPARVRRLRPHTGQRVFGREARHLRKQRNSAEVDDRRGDLESGPGQAGGSAWLACTPQLLGRTGAVGHHRTRLAGRAWSQAVSDRHDR